MMFDVFISHSGKDKLTFVEPLVEELKTSGLWVWYDKDSIIWGDDIKDKIITGIQNAISVVIILSKSFLESCWANFELGIAQTSNVRIITLLYDIDLSTIAEKYPFILGSKYLLVENNKQSEIVRCISETIMATKEEMGFVNLQMTNLLEITKKLHSYNNFKLDQLAVYMRNIIKEIDTGQIIALNTITSVLDFIICDICETEHIYMSENTNKLDTIAKSGILNDNVFQHFRFLYKIRDEVLKSITRSHEPITKQDIYLVQFSLYSIIDWYTKNYFRFPIIDNKGIVPILPLDITDEEMFETYNIEKLLLPPELIAGPEMTKDWFSHNNLTLLGSRDKETGKLIGFIHTLPVTDDLFNKISSGDFDDTIISNSDIRQYDIPGFYKLYMSSICVHPKYNGSIAFKVMYDEFINMLLTLAQENGIYISEILADGVTPKGRVLCESIGMIKHCISTHGTQVYKALLFPPSMTTLKLINQHGKRLLEYYQRVYEKYKEMF
jgi:hypothetical protein